ncbi:MAG: hypothetical protein ACRCXZ_09960 [Patescibacteria group bacterium]
MDDQQVNSSESNLEVVKSELTKAPQKSASVIATTEEKASKSVTSAKIKITIAAILAVLVICTGFFWEQVLDSAFPRKIEVRNEGFSFSTQPNTVLTDESTAMGDFTVTALLLDGKSVTLRVDESFPRIFGEQRRETFGNIKSTALLSKEHGCKTMIFKASGVDFKFFKFLKRYAVLKTVGLPKECKL